MLIMNKKNLNALFCGTSGDNSRTIHQIFFRAYGKLCASCINSSLGVAKMLTGGLKSLRIFSLVMFDAVFLQMQHKINLNLFKCEVGSLIFAFAI